MKLTSTQIKNAKPKDKPQKLFDGKGMHLLITTTGSKLWRFDYRINKSRKTISLGVYPDVGLKDARERLTGARELVARGVDPSVFRKIQKEDEDENTFEIVAKEWFSKHSPNWAESHSSKIINRLNKDVFPWLGLHTTSEITAPELLTIIRRVENRGALETAHRILQNCGQIFRYAIATGRAERDPAADLKGALPPTKSKSYASIKDPVQIGALLRVIDGYQGSFITKCALQIAPQVFVRPGELRQAEWSEFNFDTKEWRIPAEKMKTRKPHIVPLSHQVLLILAELHPVTGKGKYVFPGVRSSSRSMSENTVNGALRRLGYTKDEMTGHGFRSIASTWLNEMQWNADAIEVQLAHIEENSVRAVYNFAKYLDIRRKMMQFWSDYLEQLKNTKKGMTLESWEASQEAS